MKLKKKKIDEMIELLDKITEKAIQYENNFAEKLSLIHPEYKKSAINFLHYLALRENDIRDLQEKLGELGISRLARAESNVLASILAVKNLLRKLNKLKKQERGKGVISRKKARKIIRKNTNALLGKKLKGAKTRIMVTLPKEAVDEKNLINELIEAGMSAARINCAHDSIDIWYKLIDKIHSVKKRTGKNCRVCMDLGGPKLRTGKMIPGPKVVHLTPLRDTKGRVIEPCTLLLAKEGTLPSEEYPVILPFEEEFLMEIQIGDKLTFIDTRNKKRNLKVVEQAANGFVAKLFDSAYIETAAEVSLLREENIVASTQVGNLIPIEEYIVLKSGDILTLLADQQIDGQSAKIDENGNIINSAFVSCTLPEVFKDVKEGELIVFDDGKIEGKIIDVKEDKVVVEIFYAKEVGEKLKADKGINLPESNLNISGLTEKDKEDLRFIAKNADVVNFSFVNSGKDVQDLFEELKKLEREDLGIILKIETKKGFKNLPEILLTAMQHYPIGVMIARGDLAIEMGWKNLAKAQEELLSLCEAVHIPIVWATQVLETHAKKGRPSRSEITDAALAERAECVMLNKGPHIVKTVKLLSEILKDAEEYQDKKSTLLPVLQMFNPFNN